MKKLSILLVIIFSTLLLANQKDQITEKQLEKIRNSFKKNAETNAIINALTKHNIKDLVYNQKKAGKIDHHFKYKVKVNGITDQKSSGRCWIFTSLNVFRPKVIEKLKLDNFEFSVNHLFFWDQFEKANLFLTEIINTADQSMEDDTVKWLFRNAISDGGVWNMFVDLTNKYGLIPKEAMPETYSSNNTRTLSRLIRRKLREDALILRKMVKEQKPDNLMENQKIKMLSEIYRMLALNLGEPPVKFNWRFKDKDGNISNLKTYTPKAFYKEVISINLNDYVLFMDNPTRDYNKLYEIQYDRDLLEGHNWRYINLPAEKIKSFAKESIKNNEAMYFSCDVGKQLNKESGILAVDNFDYESILGVTFGMNKADRIRVGESGSTHGMALVGVDIDKKGKPCKWLLENSWGQKSGNKGYLTMTDKWFDEYMFRLVIHKKFIDSKTLKILKQKPIKCPPWDPMFMYEE